MVDSKCRCFYLVQKYFISRGTLISWGGQILENKSLAKMDNPNTSINKQKLIRKIKSLWKWQPFVIREKKKNSTQNKILLQYDHQDYGQAYK